MVIAIVCVKHVEATQSECPFNISQVFCQLLGRSQYQLVPNRRKAMIGMDKSGERMQVQTLIEVSIESLDTEKAVSLFCFEQMGWHDVDPSSSGHETVRILDRRGSFQSLLAENLISQCSKPAGNFCWPCIKCFRLLSTPTIIFGRAPADEPASLKSSDTTSSNSPSMTFIDSLAIRSRSIWSGCRSTFSTVGS